MLPWGYRYRHGSRQELVAQRCVSLSILGVFPILKEILRPATWMNLEGIVLSELSLSQKDKYYTIPRI